MRRLTTLLVLALSFLVVVEVELFADELHFGHASIQILLAQSEPCG